MMLQSVKGMNSTLIDAVVFSIWALKLELTLVDSGHTR